MFNLEGKTAIVAGGAGYLGIPVCRGLLEHGAGIMIADINQDNLNQAIEELSVKYSKKRVRGICFDIGDEGSIKESVESTVNHFGCLNIVVNATFGATGKRLEDLTAEDFDRANRLNITGSFLLARSAAEFMPDGGSIIMYASMYGLVSPNPNDYPEAMNPNPIEYGAGKAALVQMVKYMAAHWGHNNIRVNAIAPGAFPDQSAQRKSREFIRNLCAKSMLGRIGRREETAGAAVFLASDEASFITGQVISVDGGVTSW